MSDKKIPPIPAHAGHQTIPDSFDAHPAQQQKAAEVLKHIFPANEGAQPHLGGTVGAMPAPPGAMPQQPHYDELAQGLNPQRKRVLPTRDGKTREEPAHHIIPPEDEDFLPMAVAATKASVNRGTLIFLYAILFMLVVLIVWASQAKLDEVTRSSGRVVPSTAVQLIQSLESGIVEQLYVREGELVQKDQPLLKLDDTRTLASFREGRSRLLALKAQTARLRAEADGTSLVFAPELIKEAPHLVEIERQLYDSRRRSLNAEVASFQESHRLARQEYDISTGLLQQGLISKVELLRLERGVREIEGSITNRRNRYRAEAQEALNRVNTEIGTLSEASVANEDRVQRTILRSPTVGLVKKINIASIGGVVQSGSNVMEIIPLETQLLIEVNVRPSDVGFLQVGQKARVKVSAYDSAIYGALDATLVQISADTITDERKGESFYRAKLRTDRNHLKVRGKEMPIIPGMTVTIEVLTGKKTVLDYFIRPIRNARNNALKER